MRLQCERSFQLTRTSYPCDIDKVLQNLNSHLHASRHFRFWWFPHTNKVVVVHMDKTKTLTYTDTLSHHSPTDMNISQQSNNNSNLTNIQSESKTTAELTYPDMPKSPFTEITAPSGLWETAKWWIKERLYGVHVFECALRISQCFPALIPSINRMYRYSFFDSLQRETGRSDIINSLDISLKQVCLLLK